MTQSTASPTFGELAQPDIGALLRMPAVMQKPERKRFDGRLATCWKSVVTQVIQTCVPERDASFCTAAASLKPDMSYEKRSARADIFSEFLVKF